MLLYVIGLPPTPPAQRVRLVISLPEATRSFRLNNRYTKNFTKYIKNNDFI